VKSPTQESQHPRQAAFDRFSRAVDGPLTVLALAMVPLLVVPLVVDLPRGLKRSFLAADYFIWAVFAVEYFTKLYLAPDRGTFAKTHIPDLVIVVVPFLRPLRVLRSARALRLLRLARLGAFGMKGLSNVRRILSAHGLDYVLLAGVAIVLIGAALVFEFERGLDKGNIASFPDALWWAATTVTTVGYGDRFPVSAAGRGVAVALMFTGIALFGVLTASIAAFFVEQKEEVGVEKQLGEISERLAAIERRLS
jgi:voltage-gated potassium channel